ncbi:MAG: glutamine-synthetase adenylyltransferase, partial [Novosphingobium sp.]
RAALDALAAAQIIPEEDARVLGESYDRLRVLEHRLQMVLDQQTHSLPEQAAAIDNLAGLEGLPDGAALVAELETITERVGQRYDALIAIHGDGGATSVAVPAQEPPRNLTSELAELGFPDPESVAGRIDGWRSGKIRALRSDAARAAFDAVQPELLAALAHSPDPARAFNRWETLLTQLPSALNLFHLLEARPALLELLAKVLSLAPPLADALARRADLLDPLIDSSAFDLPGSVADLAAEFSKGEVGDDYERLLDRVRRHVSELRFALGVQLIEGASDPLDIARANSRVAEAAIEVLARATVTEFEQAHGRVGDSDLVILGLGRLGGGMLTHASDLDLVYLFTGQHEAESDGRRPLGATTYFNRLAQRITAALSVPTAEGALFEVDTRLRPSGEQGPLVATFDSFDRYQREAAWTWEHMALCRARPLFGPANDRAQLSGIIAEVLTRTRDKAELRTSVLDMRARMAEHKPPKGPLDAKLLRGGLVDLEFVVHYLQLKDGKGLSPFLPEAIAALAEAGLVTGRLGQAHDRLSRMLIAARLLAPDGQVPPPGPSAALAAACGCAQWDEVMERFQDARAVVAQAWNDTFGEQLETE